MDQVSARRPYNSAQDVERRGILWSRRVLLLLVRCCSARLLSALVPPSPRPAVLSPPLSRSLLPRRGRSMASPAVASAAGTGPRMLNASTGQGRVVLISGATSDGGFGSTCGKLLAAHGARIVLTDLPVFDERGKALAAEIEKEGGRAAWFPLDVTKEEQWTKAVEFTELTYGPLDVLLNNAGIGFEYADYMRSLDASISQHPTSDWRNMMAINLDGFYFGIKAGAASMEKNPVPEGKSIINFSSVAGLTGMTGMTYTTTKWAVRGLTKHAALFLAPKNIRVNSVHPTYFDTPLLDRALRDPALDPAIQQANLARLEQAQPMNRLGNPIEVANLILYLASTESSFTTGAEHIIDGGMTTRAGYGENTFYQAAANGASL